MHSINKYLKTFPEIEYMIKIGRNELCHCNSGKKYKKCCLESDTVAKQDMNTYSPSEMLDISMEHLQGHFPNITFVNISDILNNQSYRTLQLNHMKDSICQVAERIRKNERVFKDRDPETNEYDLLLMYRGAYRILHGGHSLLQYTMSLNSFFSCPSKPVFNMNEDSDDEA